MLRSAVADAFRADGDGTGRPIGRSVYEAGELEFRISHMKLRVQKYVVGATRLAAAAASLSLK